ncbi:hypothetical protein, partial [Paracoccus caeni]|uniref:hypothetical protein n=1 Tax=Paracoccus caeni TaxID=657651 RepID=UPI001F237B27
MIWVEVKRLFFIGMPLSTVLGKRRCAILQSFADAHRTESNCSTIKRFGIHYLSADEVPHAGG